MISRASTHARTGWPILQANHFSAAALAGIGFSGFRRADAHVMALDVGVQNAFVGHSPVFEVLLDPVREFLKKNSQFHGLVSAGNLGRADQAADDCGKGGRRLAWVLFPALLVGDGGMAHQEARGSFDKGKDLQRVESIRLPQAPGQDDGKRNLVELDSAPIGGSIDPEILRKASVGLLRAGQVYQRAPGRFSSPAGQQRTRGLTISRVQTRW